MTKKDYRRLAAIVHNARSKAGPGTYRDDGPRLSREEVDTIFGPMEEALVEWLRSDNPNFDPTLFLLTCREGL